jgi:hypothetical protein
VFAVGIGKGVQREASRRLGQQFRDAGHLSDKDGVPPVKKLCVRNINPEGCSTIGKELLRVDLPSLVSFVRDVVPKSISNELLITASMPGPSGECSIEIDIDYHATEVK